MTDVHDRVQDWLTYNARVDDTRGLTATDRGDAPIGGLAVVPCVARIDVTAHDEIPLELCGTIEPAGTDWCAVDWRARRVWVETDASERTWAWYLVADEPGRWSPTLCCYRWPGVCEGAVLGVVPGELASHGACPSCREYFEDEDSLILRTNSSTVKVSSWGLEES
jgi:hypothetical protein